MYQQYFAIEKELRRLGGEPDRKEFIQQFTDGRKSGLKELTPHEYREFLNWLRQSFQTLRENTPENRMRRKMWALFVHKMGYTEEGMNQWCVKYGKHGKRLQEHTSKELTELLTQAENVYKTHLKNITS